MATAKWIEQELEKNFTAASEAGKKAAASEPRARRARYDAKNDRMVIELTNGCVFAFPPRLAQGLEGATAKELTAVEVTPRGEGLHWESLDVDLSVPGLVVGVFGSKAWMRSFARRGGSATSEAKTLAARENGKKGGRPVGSGKARRKSI